METGAHLWRCLVYVDLNMVRAEVVPHPRGWPHCGYHEIQIPWQRYRIIGRETLCEVLAISDVRDLAELHEGAVQAAMREASGRGERWTRSLAVGSRRCVGGVATALGARGIHRRVREIAEDSFVLRDPPVRYSGGFASEKSGLARIVAPSADPNSR